MSDINSENAPPAAHPASTVILLRPQQDTFEVLLLLRAKAVQFAGGSWVFPGGRIDPEDYNGHTDDIRSAAKAAATRESFEEAGLNLDAENFYFFSHWTTPIAEKKRFSTWFLLGLLSENQTIKIDDSEIVDHLWLTPEKALLVAQQGELKILPPTYLTLLELSQCKSCEDAIALTQSREFPKYFPNMVFHEQVPSILLAGDEGYESGTFEHSGQKHRVVMTAKGWEYIKS